MTEIYTRIFIPLESREVIYLRATEWIDSIYGPDRITIWDTGGPSWISRTYYAGFIFYSPEDITAFRLRFPELTVSIEK